VISEQELNEALLKLNKKSFQQAGVKVQKEFNTKFDLLKKKHKDGKLVPADISQVIHALYRVPPEHIVDETHNVFKVVRFCIFAGVPFLINPALGLIGWLVDRVIEEKINEKYEATVLKKYRKELEHIEAELKKPNLSEDEKENLENAKRHYKDGINKLERYYENLKTYKHPMGTDDSSDDDDDFNMDFDFHESMNLTNGGSAMMYSDEEMTKRMVKQYQESIDQMILMCLESGGFPELELLDESKARHLARQFHSKIDRADRKSSGAIDSVADPVLDGGKKNEVKKIRQDILEGRLKVSTLFKRALSYALIHFTFGPQAAAISAIVWLTRKGWVKKRQKEEMLAELKSELEIINEKIKDAESDNDKKKKYQYIRLRREIQRNIDRIRYNDTLKNMDHGVY
jgi:hypothetical protein